MDAGEALDILSKAVGPKARIRFPRTTPIDRGHLLNNTQRWILRYIWLGWTMQDIGVFMDLSKNQVNYNRAILYRKLGIRTMVDAALMAERNRDLMPDGHQLEQGDRPRPLRRP